MADLASDARKAMLARLAGDLNVLAHVDQVRWSCCWQSFDHFTPWGAEQWIWRFCNGGMPGEYFATRPCSHWHHRHEPPPLALARVPA
jgi:hypothetical protein